MQLGKVSPYHFPRKTDKVSVPSLISSFHLGLTISATETLPTILIHPAILPPRADIEGFTLPAPDAVTEDLEVPFFSTAIMQLVTAVWLLGVQTHIVTPYPAFCMTNFSTNVARNSLLVGHFWCQG